MSLTALALTCVPFLVHTAPSNPWTDTTQRLVNQLHLERLPPGQGLAVTILPSGFLSSEPLHFLRALQGRLRDTLSAYGPESLFFLETDPNTDALYHRARLEGAENLILVRVQKIDAQTIEIVAERHVVDRGLWAPAPTAQKPFIAALAKTTLPRQGPWLSTHEPERPSDEANAKGQDIRLKFGAAPKLLERSSGRVVAMARCPHPRNAPQLVVLLKRHQLSLHAYRAGTWAPQGIFSFNGLPRAQEPVREGMGSVQCFGRGQDSVQLVFGHTDLKHGYLLHAHPRGDAQYTLRIKQTLEGTPILARPKQTPSPTESVFSALVLGHADLGRNRWAKKVLLLHTQEPTNQVSTAPVTASVFEPTHRRQKELPQPILQGAAVPPRSPFAFVVLLEDYQLAGMGADLTAQKKLGPSGVGFSLFTWKGSVFLVKTQDDMNQDEQLTLATLDGRPMDRMRLRTPAHATLGVFGAKPGILAATWPDDNRTDLYFVPITDGTRPDERDADPVPGSR